MCTAKVFHTKIGMKHHVTLSIPFYGMILILSAWAGMTFIPNYKKFQLLMLFNTNPMVAIQSNTIVKVLGARWRDHHTNGVWISYHRYFIPVVRMKKV